MLLINLSLAVSSVNLERDIRELEDKLAEKKGIEVQAYSLIRRIDYYKALKQTTLAISQNVEAVLTLTPANVRLGNIGFTKNSARLTVASVDPLAISFLINQYLQSDHINEVALLSANLNTLEDEFSAELEVYFK